MNTKLTLPVAVTRTVTDRIILDLNGDGVLELWDATHQNRHATVDLVKQPVQRATYELTSPFYCGAVVIQQSDWEILCRGEAGLVLGSVDFPFLTGAPYKVYPQQDRATVFSLEFAKTETGAQAVVCIETEGGMRTRQICEIRPATAFSIAVVAFTERTVVEEPGREPGRMQQRIAELPAGGTVTFDPPLGAIDRVALPSG